LTESQNHPAAGSEKRNKIIKENGSASLIDIGDGVACLEFHTKMNSIDEPLTVMLTEACDIVEKDFEGMVVANHDERAFSAGANVFAVLTAAQLGQWDLLEKSIEALQNGNMKMKYLSKPVVTAPAGLALGGGCEMAMHGARCLPNGETYMGLVEVGRRRDSRGRRLQRNSGSLDRRHSRWRHRRRFEYAVPYGQGV